MEHDTELVAAVSTPCIGKSGAGMKSSFHMTSAPEKATRPDAALDTIAAVARPPGSGGVGIVRISGALAPGILNRLFRPSSPRFAGFHPWMLHRGRVCDASGGVLDDCLAVLMPGPRSFTGEDVVELQCHGGPALLDAVLERAVECGARLAERGEFTRRAFMNGRIDLSQAEAVAEMIAAPSRWGARLALNTLEGVLGRRVAALRGELETLRAGICLAVDFPEEEAECLPPAVLRERLERVDQGVTALLAGFERSRCWREGVQVALAGPVNAGKSSLMNAFLGRERAIVTERPGTTRDFLEETVVLAGLAVRLVDTAGLRGAVAAEDPVEAAGIRLGRDRTAAADVVLLVADGSVGLAPDMAELAREWGPERVILVWNKADVRLPSPEGSWAVCPCSARIAVSARTGQGLEELAALVRRTALARLDGREPEPDEAVPNLRQAESLKRGLEELRALKDDVRSGVPYDVCAVRLETAAAALGEVIGLDTPDEVLNRIFASFCIGK